MRKSKFIIIMGFYANLKESDIENNLNDRFYKFAIDFEIKFLVLITWLQDASLEAGSEIKSQEAPSQIGMTRIRLLYLTVVL